MNTPFAKWSKGKKKKTIVLINGAMLSGIEISFSKINMVQPGQKKEVLIGYDSQAGNARKQEKCLISPLWQLIFSSKLPVYHIGGNKLHQLQVHRSFHWSLPLSVWVRLYTRKMCICQESGMEVRSRGHTCWLFECGLWFSSPLSHPTPSYSLRVSSMTLKVPAELSLCPSVRPLRCSGFSVTPALFLGTGNCMWRTPLLPRSVP